MVQDDADLDPRVGKRLERLGEFFHVLEELLILELRSEVGAHHAEDADLWIRVTDDLIRAGVELVERFPGQNIGQRDAERPREWVFLVVDCGDLFV